MIIVGVDTASKNCGIAIINLNLDILQLVIASHYTTEVKSKPLKKCKLNKETGKYEKVYKQLSWTDYNKLEEFFKPYIGQDIIYVVEKVFSKPIEGTTNAFINGNSLGIYQGMKAYLQPKYFYNPRPQEWKGDLNISSDKGISVELANKIFEKSLKENNIKLKKGKSKNSSDDFAEALLLCIWGIKQYMKQIEME